MADFRSVDVSAIRWFPQSRKTVPATPVRVQVPAAPCTVALAPGRYVLDLVLAAHPAHAAFVDFVRRVEEAAVREARPAVAGLRWCPCLDADSLVPTLRLSAFDDTRFYDAAGGRHAAPEGARACACLLELGGAWTTDGCWGLRWKVLEVKECAPLGVPCMLLDDDGDGGVPCMILDDAT